MENSIIMTKSKFVFKFKLNLTSNIKNLTFLTSDYIMLCSRTGIDIS